MLAIISPAKTLDFESAVKIFLFLNRTLLITANNLLRFVVNFLRKIFHHLCLSAISWLV